MVYHYSNGNLLYLFQKQKKSSKQFDFFFKELFVLYELNYVCIR